MLYDIRFGLFWLCRVFVLQNVTEWVTDWLSDYPTPRDPSDLKTLQILYPFLKSSNLAPECESIYLLHSNIVTNFMDKHSSWCKFRVCVWKVLIDVHSITIFGTGSFEKSYSHNTTSYIMTEIGIKIIGIEPLSGKIKDVGYSCFQCQFCFSDTLYL